MKKVLKLMEKSQPIRSGKKQSSSYSEKRIEEKSGRDRDKRKSLEKRGK
jgi:hypothetical protein